jgi:hypothetical protein
VSVIPVNGDVGDEAVIVAPPLVNVTGSLETPPILIFPNKVALLEAFMVKDKP